jgi:acylphosphatase
MENKRLRLIVKGRVQGVFFRNYTKIKALSLGLIGKVRNLKSGEVEIIVTGKSEVLNEFIQWTYIGSPLSKVSEVTIVEENEMDENLTDFFIEEGKF